MEYLILNILLFGSIYAFCKGMERIVWEMIENYEDLQNMR